MSAQQSTGKRDSFLPKSLHSKEFFLQLRNEHIFDKTSTVGYSNILNFFKYKIVKIIVII